MLSHHDCYMGLGLGYEPSPQGHFEMTLAMYEELLVLLHRK